jgi:hypothetical protein
MVGQCLEADVDRSLPITPPSQIHAFMMVCSFLSAIVQSQKWKHLHKVTQKREHSVSDSDAFG